MLFRSKIKPIVGTLLLSAMLAGCSEVYFDRRASDLYWDRRESVAAHGGDAVATNRVTHTIDPWSPASANRNIAFNGERMQAAAERYRTGCVIQPAGVSSSLIVDNSAQQQAQRPAHCSNSQASNSAPAPAPINKP